MSPCESCAFLPGGGSVEIGHARLHVHSTHNASYGMSAMGQKRKSLLVPVMSASPAIVLQNSKLAVVQIFGENQKRKEVDDSHSVSRVTEVAHEFGARR